VVRGAVAAGAVMTRSFASGGMRRHAGGRTYRPSMWSVRGQSAPRSARRRQCLPGSVRRRNACAALPRPRAAQRPAAGCGPRGRPGPARPGPLL
jgi:hypothetical protein